MSWMKKSSWLKTNVFMVYMHALGPRWQCRCGWVAAPALPTGSAPPLRCPGTLCPSPGTPGAWGKPGGSWSDVQASSQPSLRALTPMGSLCHLRAAGEGVRGSRGSSSPLSWVKAASRVVFAESTDDAQRTEKMTSLATAGGVLKRKGHTVPPVAWPAPSHHPELAGPKAAANDPAPQ